MRRSVATLLGLPLLVILAVVALSASGWVSALAWVGWCAVMIARTSAHWADW